jgi:hypothetical protein
MAGNKIISEIFKGTTPVRMGINEFFWSDTLFKLINQGYPVVKSGSEWASYSYLESVGLEGNVSPVDSGYHFHLDFNRGNFFQKWFNWEPLNDYLEILDETEDWKIEKNGSGSILKKLKHKSSAPEHIDFTLTSPKIWEDQYRENLLDLNVDRVKEECILKEMRRSDSIGQFTYFGHYFIWEIMRISLGDVCLYESVLLETEWIKDICRVYTDFFKTHMQYLFDHVYKPDGVFITDDLGYKNGPFCSPSLYSELIFPFYQEYIDFLHNNKVKALMHSCGNIQTILGYLINTGIDLLHPMERKAGCSPLEIAEQYGDTIVLNGGLDVRILEDGDKDVIKKEVKNLLEEMKRTGTRYIFGSDHSISTNVSYNDYKYTCDIFWDNCYYL